MTYRPGMLACSNGLCTLYALRTLCHLAEQVGAAPMTALAAQWAPPLWRLLLAEPGGADFWVMQLCPGPKCGRLVTCVASCRDNDQCQDLQILI